MPDRSIAAFCTPREQVGGMHGCETAVALAQW